MVVTEPVVRAVTTSGSQGRDQSLPVIAARAMIKAAKTPRIRTVEPLQQPRAALPAVVRTHSQRA